MKDPISTHNNHGDKINEIFGKIAKFFSPFKKDDGMTAKITKTGTPIPLSRKEKEDIIARRNLEYQRNIEKYRESRLVDPSFCDPGYTPKETKGKKSGKSSPKKSFKISVLPSGGIMIDKDKIIKDFSELYVENTVRGQGMGSFRKITVRDFVCYHKTDDLFGISWLFDDNASYEAQKISGKLSANKFNQSVNFSGEWFTGKFYGRIIGSRIILPNTSPSKSDLSKKYENLKNLISQTSKDFIDKFGNLSNSEIENKVNSSDDNELKNSLDDFFKIKKYLTSNFSVKQGMGTSTYVQSNELSRIKSMIDQNLDEDDTLVEIEDLYKNFKMISSKINKFYNKFEKLSSASTPSTPTSGSSTGGSFKPIKIKKKP